MAGAFFGELGLPRPDHSLGIGGGTHAEQTARDAAGTRAASSIESARTPSSSTATRTRRSPGHWPRPSSACPSRTSRRACARSTGGCPRRSTGSSPTTCRPLAVRADAGGGRQPRRGGHRRRASTWSATSCRTSRRGWSPRSARRRRRSPPSRDRFGRVARRRAGYLFATIHRAENREPDAIAAGRRCSPRRRVADRPVVLALHPGTRAALARGAASISAADRRVVEPLGYRTRSPLQLHAAAVLTDSGGVQREAAWLGRPVPGPAPTTEWVEAVAAPAAGWSSSGWTGIGRVSELARLAAGRRDGAVARGGAGRRGAGSRHAAGAAGANRRDCWAAKPWR